MSLRKLLVVFLLLLPACQTCDAVCQFQKASLEREMLKDAKEATERARQELKKDVEV